MLPRSRHCRSADEVGEGHTEGVGQEQQISEVEDSVRVLPPANRLVLPAHAFPELHLSEVRGSAGFADLFSDLLPTAGHPVGERVVHPPTVE